MRFRQGNVKDCVHLMLADSARNVRSFLELIAFIHTLNKSTSSATMAHINPRFSMEINLNL